GEGRREGGGSRGKKGAVREEGQSSPPPPMIRDDIRIIWACSESAMNGSASSSVTKIARIFGTNTRVCSWIWVSAWNSDTTTPTTRPTTIKGDDTTTRVQIASRATSRVSGPVILHSLFPLTPSSLRAKRSNPDCIRGKTLDCVVAALLAMTSDRHLHDVFVGLDHAVAHRHQGRHRDVGLRHRGDHIHHIRLARGHRHRLRVRLAPR